MKSFLSLIWLPFFCQLFPLSPVVNAKLNTHCITPRISRKPFFLGKVFHIVDPMLSSASKMVPHWLKRSRTSVFGAWFHGVRNPKNVRHAFLMVSSIEKEKVKGCEGVMCLVCLGGFQAKGTKTTTSRPSSSSLFKYRSLECRKNNQRSKESKSWIIRPFPRLEGLLGLWFVYFGDNGQK